MTYNIYLAKGVAMFSLLKRLLQTQGEPTSSIPEEELNFYIDLAVKQFDSRLSAIPGYRKKLRRPVETALLYLESLIERIPGPIEVSKSAYGSDPRVHAYFGSFEQIEHLFSHSRDFREYTQRPASFGLSHGYALMIMSRQEKRRPGHVLKGDHVQSDVMQEVVVFSSHHLATPAISDLETRKALLIRKFRYLVADAEKRMTRHTERKANLQRQQIALRMKLKTSTAVPDPVDFVTESAEKGNQEYDTLTQQQRATESETGEASRSLETINDYLELLIEVLGNPSECCTLTIHSDCLNRANAKVDLELGNEIPYAVMRIGELQHHLVIVNYPLGEMTDRSSTANLLHSVYEN